MAIKSRLNIGRRHARRLAKTSYKLEGVFENCSLSEQFTCSQRETVGKPDDEEQVSEPRGPTAFQP